METYNTDHCAHMETSIDVESYLSNYYPRFTTRHMHREGMPKSFISVGLQKSKYREGVRISLIYCLIFRELEFIYHDSGLYNSPSPTIDYLLKNGHRQGLQHLKKMLHKIDTEICMAHPSTEYQMRFNEILLALYQYGNPNIIGYYPNNNRPMRFRVKCKASGKEFWSNSSRTIYCEKSAPNYRNLPLSI